MLMMDSRTPRNAVKASFQSPVVLDKATVRPLNHHPDPPRVSPMNALTCPEMKLRNWPTSRIVIAIR